MRRAGLLLSWLCSVLAVSCGGSSDRNSLWEPYPAKVTRNNSSTKLQVFESPEGTFLVVGTAWEGHDVDYVIWRGSSEWVDFVFRRAGAFRTVGGDSPGQLQVKRPLDVDGGVGIAPWDGVKPYLKVEIRKITFRDLNGDMLSFPLRPDDQ